MPKAPTRFTTIFTDASFCHDSDAAGWACWIKGPEYERAIVRHGRFKEPPESVDLAEMQAVLNGLHFAQAANLIEDHILVIEPDSMLAISYFTKGPGTSRAKNRKVILQKRRELKTFFDELTKPAKAVRFKHVKGHSKSQGKRSWVNDVVDKHSRAAMEAHRKDLGK